MRIDVKLNSSLFSSLSLSFSFDDAHTLLFWSLNMCAGTLTQIVVLPTLSVELHLNSIFLSDSLLNSLSEKKKKNLSLKKVNTSSMISVPFDEKSPSCQLFEHDRPFLTVTLNVVWESTCTFIKMPVLKLPIFFLSLNWIGSRLNNTKIKCNSVNNLDLKCQTQIANKVSKHVYLCK